MLGEPDDLPSVDDAKVQAARDMGATMTRYIEGARAQRQKAMTPLDGRRLDMTRLHREERTKLHAEQKARERSDRLNKGLRGLWDRFFGRWREVVLDNIAEAQAALTRDREQRQELIVVQLGERRQLQTEIKTERNRHSEMLRELRVDRQRYVQELPKPVRAEERSPSGLKTAFARSARPQGPAIPDPRGILDDLRKGNAGERLVHDWDRKTEN